MPTTTRTASHAYRVAGGIASMAAAAFMIRDGDMFGQTMPWLIRRLGLTSQTEPTSIET